MNKTGRKAEAGEARTNRPIRFSDAEWLVCKKIGGAERVRELVAAEWRRLLRLGKRIAAMQPKPPEG